MTVILLQRLGDGYSPAHIAIDNEDFECLKTCLECGADPEVRSYKKETPQQLAHFSGLVAMASTSILYLQLPHLIFVGLTLNDVLLRILHPIYYCILQ